MVIDGLAGRLNQEHVSATDGLVQRNGNLTVSEGLDDTLTHGQTQLLTDGLCKSGVGVATENLNVISVCNHLCKYLISLYLS
jgi:hypothetical protein